jgi:Bacterial Ig domain
VQADPAAGLSQPLAPPLDPIVGGATIESATGQLAGGIDYTDTIPTASTTRWYSLQANGSGQVQVNVENTSQSNAPCGPLIVRFYDASGASIDGQDLPDDTGYTFKVSEAGVYYISAQDNDCEPGEKPPMTLQIEISPPEAVTPSPAFGGPSPPTCADVSASTTSEHAVTVQLACSGGSVPLTYVILSPPAHGTLSNLNPSTGTVTYTPAAKYTGPDSFAYNAATSTGLQSAEATATITVALSGNATKKGENEKPTSTGGKGKKAAGKGTHTKGKGAKGSKGKPLTSAQKKQLAGLWRKLLGETETAIHIVDAAKKAIEIAAAYKTVRDVLHADKLIDKAINAGVELLKAAIDKAIEQYASNPAAKTALETAKHLVGLAGKELKDAAKDEALDQATDAAKKYIDQSRKRLEAIKREAQQEIKRLSTATTKTKSKRIAAGPSTSRRRDRSQAGFQPPPSLTILPSSASPGSR